MNRTEPLMNSHTQHQHRTTTANATPHTPYLRAPWARRTALTLFSALLITGCGGGGGGGDGNGEGGAAFAGETVVSAAGAEAGAR
jgi:hypothetical protein